MKFSIKKTFASCAALALIGSTVAAIPANAAIDPTRQVYSDITTTSKTQRLASVSTHMSDWVRERRQMDGYIDGQVWEENEFEVDEMLAKGYGNFVNSFRPDPNNRSNNSKAYYECYGFALKLASEYFGTKSFIRLQGVNFNESTYKPRLGDVLRVGKNGAGFHSIFVTAINGNKITYVDCNINGDNKIKWNQTIDIKNGFSIGKSKYNQIVWVERPMMVGDFNGDTEIDITDVADFTSFISMKDPMKSGNFRYRNAAGNLNKDKSIDLTDLSLLRSYVMKNDGKYAFLKYQK